MIDQSDLAWRFIFHSPDIGAKARHEDIRSQCLQLAMVFNAKLPESREKSLALTKVEEAMFWANAAIARQKED